MVKSFSAGVSCFQCFSGLSGGPWQARKYSVRRDHSDWTQVGMIILGNRIRYRRPPRKRGTQYAAAHPRHCERSEAIHSLRGSMDCFALSSGAHSRDPSASNDVDRYGFAISRLLAAIREVSPRNMPLVPELLNVG